MIDIPSQSSTMTTLIVGLGNPILGDDGVGWRVAEEVSKQSGIALGDAPLPGLHDQEQQPITIECYSLAGLSLMERLVGFDRVVLIDALNTGKHPQGEVVCFSLDEMEDLTHGHTTSAHDVSLKQALKLGRSMGESLPDDAQVHIVAVEASHIYDFQEELTSEVEAAVPLAVQKVLELLGK